MGAAVADDAPSFDLLGHRGARGLMPENTLAAFATALAIGVTTLELDVGVTRDGVVVVRHDTALNPAIARGPDGSWIGRGAQRPIKTMTFADLQLFDVGRLDPNSRYAARFATQQAVDGARIPRLRDVIDLAARAGNDVVRFSVETKLSPLAPEETINPKAFAAAVVAVLRDLGVTHRSSVQSFDWRTLRHIQRIAPEIPTVYLTARGERFDTVQVGRRGPSPWTAGLDVDDHGGSVPRLVAAAGGRVWSVRAADLDAAVVAEAHALGLTVLVWTVNDPAEMARFIALGVDGIITDYPDRLRRVVAQAGKVLPEPTPVAP